MLFSSAPQSCSLCPSVSLTSWWHAGRTLVCRYSERTHKHPHTHALSHIIFCPSPTHLRTYHQLIVSYRDKSSAVFLLSNAEVSSMMPRLKSMRTLYKLPSEAERRVSNALCSFASKRKLSKETEEGGILLYNQTENKPKSPTCQLELLLPHQRLISLRHLV